MVNRGSILATPRPMSEMLLSVSIANGSVKTSSRRREVGNKPSSTVRMGSVGFSASPFGFLSSPLETGCFSSLVSFAGVLDITIDNNEAV